MNVDSAKTAQQVIHTIFLADDDPDDRYMFSEALRELHADLQLHCIQDGSELMSLLDHLYPDLLFLDLEMPRKNGLECLKELRGRATYAGLPTVVFSSTNRVHNINTAYEMGAHLFMHKPDTFQQMKVLLHKILGLDWRNPEAIQAEYFREGQGKVFD